MTKYNQKYMLVFMTNLLHPSKLVDSSYFPASQTFWDNFVKTGSSHLVLPALYAALKRKNLEHYLPDDLLKYLKDISDLNYVQNKAILKQIAFVSKIFKKNKIEYLFLKGAAMLLLNPYDIMKERMIGDIDILVAEKDIQKAQKILISQGFSYQSNEYNFVKDIIPLKHLKRIIHPDYRVAVELHRRLLVSDNFNQINPKDVLNCKTQINNRFNIPSRKHMWLHAIYNWQYNDNGFDYNKFSLRTFLDVIFLEPKNVYDELPLHPALSHYYSICSVLTGDYKNSSRLHSLFFKYQMLFPRFQSLFFLTVKFKLGLSFVFNRLSLFLSSKLYRDRLFQNPKIITKRILSIWDRS